VWWSVLWRLVAADPKENSIESANWRRANDRARLSAAPPQHALCRDRSTPEGDPYEIDGWPRHLVKRAFNILVNAKNVDSARQAIALEITGEGAHARATSLIDAIKLKHPKIADMFHSDAGIRLQRRDADMAEVIMRRLVGLGIFVLPIHDSFITAARHDGALREAMNLAWTQFVRKDKLIIPIGYGKIDPQMEEKQALVASPVSGSGSVHLSS